MVNAKLPMDFPIWKGNENEFRVFLSYKDSSNKETLELASNLKLYGIDCFVAKYAPTPAEWLSQIEAALSSMDAFVPLITDEYHNSFWTNQEIGFAFAKKVPIIPIKLETKNPQGFIYANTAISSTWNEAPYKIAQELVKTNSPKMVDALIIALEQCPSYGDAENFKGLFDQFLNISDQQAKNLIFAFNQNDQVNGSYAFGGKNTKRGDPLLSLLRQKTNTIYEFEDNDYILPINRPMRIKKRR